MRNGDVPAVGTLVIGVMFVLVTGVPRAEMAAGTATAEHVTGRVEVLVPGQPEWVPLAQGASMPEGTQVRCLAGAAAEVMLPNQVSVLVAENTRYVLTRLAAAPGGEARNLLSHLLVGKVVAAVRNAANGPVAPRASSRYIVSTPTGLVVVTGIDIVLSYDPAAAKSVLVGLPSSAEGVAGAAATYVAFATGASRVVGPGTFVTHVAGQVPSLPASVAALPPVVQQQLATPMNSATAGSAILTRESVIIVGPRTIHQVLSIWGPSLASGSAPADEKAVSASRPGFGQTEMVTQGSPCGLPPCPPTPRTSVPSAGRRGVPSGSGR